MMPILGALIGNLFAGIAAFFVRVVVSKLAMRMIGVAALSALGVALIVAFNSWIAPLVSQLFSTSYGQVLGLAFPPVAGTVLSVYFLAWTSVLTYKLQARAVALTAAS